MRPRKPITNHWGLDNFRKHGVNVLLVKTAIDPNSEFAPMLKAFEGVQASQYSKKLSELTLRGAMNNDIYSSGGTAPYGYCRTARNTKTGLIRPLAPREWCVKKQEKVFWSLGDELEVQTVRIIFEQRSKGVSLILIAKGLNEKDTPCAKRGRWRNFDRKWSIGTIKSILENPVYCGTRTYNRFSTSKILAAKKKRVVRARVRWPAWRNPKEEWSVVENAHEGIVSRELWRKANATCRHTQNPKPNGHTYRSRYLLTGLIQCSKCGFAYQGWSGNVRGKHYYRYIDGGWQSKRECSFFSIPQDTLENFALQLIRDLIREPALVDRIEEQVASLSSSALALVTDDRKAYEAALFENRKRFDNLLGLVEEGQGPGQSVSHRLKELEQERERIEKQLAQSSQPPMRIDFDEVKREVADFVLNFQERFQGTQMEERKELVQRCISKIIVDKEKRVARFYVKKVPAGSPQLESLYEGNTAGSVMTAKCARNRT